MVQSNGPNGSVWAWQTVTKGAVTTKSGDKKGYCVVRIPPEELINQWKNRQMEFAVLCELIVEEIPTLNAN